MLQLRNLVVLVMIFCFPMYMEAVPQLHVQSVIVSSIPAEITISGLPDDMPGQLLFNGVPFASMSNQTDTTFQHTFAENGELKLVSGEYQLSTPIKVIPAWMTILPPLIAILLALLLKEVLTSLFIGVFAGAMLITWTTGASWLTIPVSSFTMTIDNFVINSIVDSDHASIIVFSLLIGAMVAIITLNGGMQGVVKLISKRAQSSKSGQLATFILGVAIFFDDYANTLVVGNTMRPITDRLKISREKLSYIVDSTAAPVAAIAFITTWIGAELSYIQEGLNQIGLDHSAYGVFMNSLSYAFYPILSLVFLLMTILMNREFGPMYKAQRDKISCEIQALAGESSIHEMKDSKARWFNALIPVLSIILLTLLSLYLTGSRVNPWDDSLSVSRNLSLILGAADTYKSLLWSSMAGVFIAAILTLAQRLATLRQTAEAFIDGVKSMMTAILILVLAWSLANVTHSLHTADYITHLLVGMDISIYLMPAITFITAALIAFATGTSWGTMAILYPLIIPAFWAMSIHVGIETPEQMRLLYMIVSVVLAGAVMGDHCSPISDTTIMSSLASSCNHIDHVRTQMPYAVSVGVISVLVGIIPAAYGLPPWLAFMLAILVSWLLIRYIGKKVD